MNTDEHGFQDVFLIKFYVKIEKIVRVHPCSSVDKHFLRLE